MGVSHIMGTPAWLMIDANKGIVSGDNGKLMDDNQQKYYYCSFQPPRIPFQS